MPEYEAYPVDVRMSDYGYWVVTFSAAPALRMSVMVCRVGITPEQAIEDATGAFAHVTKRTVRK